MFYLGVIRVYNLLQWYIIVSPLNVIALHCAHSIREGFTIDIEAYNCPEPTDNSTVIYNEGTQHAVQTDLLFNPRVHYFISALKSLQHDCIKGA